MLKTVHNGGFFSCTTIRLENILTYFNNNMKLPIKVDSSVQFEKYKTDNLDITHEYFKENEIDIPYIEPVSVSSDKQEQQCKFKYKIFRRKIQH